MYREIWVCKGYVGGGMQVCAPGMWVGSFRITVSIPLLTPIKPLQVLYR